MNRAFVAATAACCIALTAGSTLAQGAVVPDPGPGPADTVAPSAVVVPAPAPDGTVVAAPSGAPPRPAPQVVVVEKEKKDTTRLLEDGGLGLEWVYLDADVGAAYTDLVSLKASNWALVDNTASGPAFGVGAGIRLVFLSAGLRVRDLQLSSFNLWETNAEVALHFRIWRIDGYVGGRGGYAFLGSFSADSLRASTGSSASDVTVHGWNVGPTAGLDFYFTKRISIGVDANAEVLFLKRPPLPLRDGQTVAPQYEALYEQSGSSVGAGFVAMSHFGVHF